MWLIIAGSVLAGAVAGVIYLVFGVAKFGGIQAIAGERKWLKYIISFLCIAGVFAAVSYAMSVVNAIIVLLHEALFFILFGVIMRIVRAASGKEFAVNWQGWLAIAASVIYFLIGYYLLCNVWQKDYNIKTDKQVSLKIAMFADSHLGTSFDGDEFAAHIKSIAAQNPDILVIPGDFVDDSTDRADLEKACKALGELDLPYGVWYSYGNHDRGYYGSRNFGSEQLEAELEKNGVHVMKDKCELVADSFYIAGRRDSSMGDRLSIDELLAGVDESKYIIVLDHQPNDYENESKSAADLVLSGHTHGGQVLGITYIGELFGINDKTYGYENRSGTDFIVTSGISDWEIMFKTGTKSEYVIINVESGT